MGAALVGGIIFFVMRRKKSRRNSYGMKPISTSVSRESILRTSSVDGLSEKSKSRSRSLTNLSTRPERGTALTVTHVSRHDRTHMSRNDRTNMTSTSYWKNNNTTTFTFTTELSIPLFLEMKHPADFRQGQFLAKGGGGYVHICEPISRELIERSKGCKLVMKSSKKSMAEMNDKEKDAFWQELSLLYKFRKFENFPAVYGFTTEPIVCMIMKFYEYGDLERFIYKNGKVARMFPYSKSQIVSLFKQLCTAIHYMTFEGFCHCDVKPSNALLDVNEAGKLVLLLSDFGISKVLDPNSLKVTAFKVSRVNGASVQYAAPDALFRLRSKMLIKDPAVWKAGDVYSLSITLLEMLQRKLAWQ